MRLVQRLLIIFCVLVAMPAQASGTTIRVSTSYGKPLSTPEQTGMLDLIVKEAFRRIGLDAEVALTPTARSLVAVNDGVFDAEINRIMGLEKSYPNLVRVPEPNMQMEFVAFSKRSIPISGWDSIAGLRVGLVNGWKILERNTREFRNVTKLQDITDLFRMLEMDRLDVVLYSKLAGYEQVHELRFEGIRSLEPPLVVQDMFMYLNKTHADLVDPLADALRSMKADGTYDRIITETTGHLH